MKILNFLQKIVIFTLILAFTANIFTHAIAYNSIQKYSYNSESESEIESEESLKSKSENSKILASYFNFNSLNLAHINFKSFNSHFSTEFINEVLTSPPNNC